MRFKRFANLIFILAVMALNSGCELKPTKDNNSSKLNFEIEKKTQQEHIQPDNWKNLSNENKQKVDEGEIRTPGFGIETMTAERIKYFRGPYAMDVGVAWITVKVCPDADETYTFTIENIGELPDIYTLTGKSTRGWGDFSSLPDEVSLNAGEKISFEIPFTVPATSSADKDALKLEAVSQSDPGIIDTSTAVIEVDNKVCR